MLRVQQLGLPRNLPLKRRLLVTQRSQSERLPALATPVPPHRRVVRHDVRALARRRHRHALALLE
eukprot:1985819-Pleurochrysis_carterae.AAC.1